VGIRDLVKLINDGKPLLENADERIKDPASGGRRRWSR
jgi:hypothetical protein